MMERGPATDADRKEGGMHMDDQLDHGYEMALARYEIIAPLVCRPLNKGQLCQIADEVSRQVHDFPGGARRFNRRTILRWAFRYRTCPAEGRLGKLQALMADPRSDKGKPRVVDAEIIEKAVRLRLEEPSRSTDTLLTLLENPPELKEATLAYHLRTRGVTRLLLKAEGRAYPRYEHKHRNALWQGDFSAGPWLPDPNDPKKMRRTHLHVFIDDHTRYIAHGEFYFRENLPCLEDAFRKAVLKGGVPTLGYVDQGAVYRARQFQFLAARLGMKLVFATPYAPEGKGKVERFFGVIKSRFYPEAERSGLTTLEELNAFFWAWLEECYHDRVHGETEQTPRERWDAQADKARFIEPHRLPDIFLWEEERKVQKTGAVPLHGNNYPLPEEMVGKKVRVLFDPFDLSRVRVYHDKRFLGTFEPFELRARNLQKAISHEKKPDRSPRDSSKELRGRLVHNWRQNIENTTVRLDSGDLLTRTEFTQILTASLDRVLSDQEAAVATEFFHNLSPLSREVVLAALGRAVQEKGHDRHVRSYLDAIKTARMKKEGI
jgi:transposase InsO family protein